MEPQDWQAFFWMGGRLASGLVEISHDPQRLDDGRFWAVSTTFEGEFSAACFATVVDSDFPNHYSWKKLSGAWQSSFSREQYINYVGAIKELIAQGWVYQVNACRQLSMDCDSNLSLAPLFTQILKENPAPRASFLQIPDLSIASASPELFLERSGSSIRTSPIKGTKPLDDLADFGAKDLAENVMIVDLMRNDFGSICQSGSITVPRLLASESHPGLTHLVSDIAGTLREKISWPEILTALSPPGSISGAPKSSAVDVISANEAKRGPYCGALGWVEGDRCELSVAIRIFWKSRDAKLHFGTGAGITWSSVADAEWEETQLKAAKLISIAGGVIK